MTQETGWRKKKKHVEHKKKNDGGGTYCAMHGHRPGDAIVPGPCNGRSVNCPQNKAKP
jgi:hypothetical protein